MAKRPQYTFTLEEALKQRLMRLPVEEHRKLADPMRAELEKLVCKAERRLAKNGKE